MDCYYLIEDNLDLFSFDEETFTTDYFTVNERTRFEQLICPKRKVEWAWGRFVAKKLVRRYYREVDSHVIPFTDIEIDNDDQGKPLFSIRNGAGKFSKNSCQLSISHRRGMVCAALVPSTSCLGLGIDCEWIEPRPKLFAETFFTASECESLNKFSEGERDTAMTTLWSIKEAVLKALGRGLTIDTNAIVVAIDELPSNHWSSCSIDFRGGESFPENVRVICQQNFIISVAVHVSEVSTDSHNFTINPLWEVFENTISPEKGFFHIEHARHA